MPEEPIHHPNDKLLKATFSNPDNARGFFENYLPEQISHAVDWDSLRLARLRGLNMAKRSNSLILSSRF